MYTSDIVYTVQTFPKEVALRSKKGEDWFKQYNWVTVPDQQIAEKPEDAHKKKTVRFTLQDEETGIPKRKAQTGKENSSMNKKKLTGWKNA
jgi:hypothetical protein